MVRLLAVAALSPAPKSPVGTPALQRSCHYAMQFSNKLRILVA